ncbi:hypothetical protein [Nostoc sp. 'Peltigera membranacea cyanobiont' 232]|uniref:hypothetical protein n=1 Tax=Nostoc sp. 'Peltigera membranacea cyanobiont' 232 TaxID=2014531 RepID=UPI000B951F92|nr:hypothetical protein [Nostoc sp. 'Peltigera membranacea cyanobiont' 232]OYE00198.1 hypothetical protein CDG79_36510 [Nostoc sp. 'Peltigera membranacea cyanobiont' 232]
MSNSDQSDLRQEIKLTNIEQLYQIKDESGQPIAYEEADGRQLFNHYRHNLTNYDQVLDNIRAEQGYLTGRQEKKASVAAAEQVLEKYRDEHIKVIKDSQKKGNLLKTIMQKAGVGTASAVVTFLDSCSEKIKEVSKLENSQRTLQTWNDTYRVQRELVKKLLIDEGVSPDTISKVNKIYSTRSVNKAVELGSKLFNLEKSEILILVKSAIRYTKL